jgi:hypothetical protein
LKMKKLIGFACLSVLLSGGVAHADSAERQRNIDAYNQRTAQRQAQEARDRATAPVRAAAEQADASLRARARAANDAAQTAEMNRIRSEVATANKTAACQMDRETLAAAQAANAANRAATEANQKVVDDWLKSNCKVVTDTTPTRKCAMVTHCSGNFTNSTCETDRECGEAFDKYVCRNVASAPKVEGFTPQQWEPRNHVREVIVAHAAAPTHHYPVNQCATNEPAPEEVQAVKLTAEQIEQVHAAGTKASGSLSG